jgi:hypothetical protein
MGRERSSTQREWERQRAVCLYVCITRTKLQTELLHKIYIISNVLSGCSQSHTHTKHDLYKDLLHLQTGVMRGTRDAAGWIRSCLVQEEPAASRPS